MADSFPVLHKEDCAVLAGLQAHILRKHCQINGQRRRNGRGVTAKADGSQNGTLNFRTDSILVKPHVINPIFPQVDIVSIQKGFGLPLGHVAEKFHRVAASQGSTGHIAHILHAPLREHQLLQPVRTGDVTWDFESPDTADDRVSFPQLLFISILAGFQCHLDAALREGVIQIPDADACLASGAK